jgi:hypothetical protein
MPLRNFYKRGSESHFNPEPIVWTVRITILRRKKLFSSTFLQKAAPLHISGGLEKSIGPN